MTLETPGPSRQSPLAFSTSHWMVLRLAIPMMITHLSTPMVGLVAIAVIGSLGDATLIAGVALASVIFDVVFVSCNFLRFSTTGLTAQAVGAQNQITEHKNLASAIWLALGLGILLVLLQKPILAVGLSVLGIDPDIESIVATYFHWRIWSAPFVLFNYVLFGWLLGRGAVMTALLLQTLLNGLGIILSCWFVLVLDWSVSGAAIASLVAESVTFLAGLILMARTIDLKRLWTLGLGSRAEWIRILSMNFDLMIRSIALLVGVSFFTRQSAGLGIDTLAANTILLRLYFVGAAFLDGFATAAEQLAGRAVGARYRPAFDFAVKATTGWGFGFAVALCLAFFLIGPTLISMIAPDAGIEALAGQFLFWTAILPIMSVTAFQMDGIFVGATWSREMRNMMLLSLAIFVLSCLTLQLAFGNHGLWLSMIIFQFARSIGFAFMLPQLSRRTFI